MDMTYVWIIQTSGRVQLREVSADAVELAARWLRRVNMRTSANGFSVLCLIRKISDFINDPKSHCNSNVPHIQYPIPITHHALCAHFLKVLEVLCIVCPSLFTTAAPPQNL